MSLLLAAVGCASPTAPAKPATDIALAGQSNAILLRPSLEALIPVIGAGDRGATAIACWAADGECWAELKPALKSAPPLKAFVWWQGEMDILQCVTDAYGACPSGYGASLADLVARVRAATGNPNLRIVVMQMGTWAAHWKNQTDVEAQTLAWVQQDRNALYVETRDQEYRTDGIHMTEAGYRAVARRIADALR